MRRLLILAVVLCGAMYAYAGPVEFTFLAWNDGNWQNGYPYAIQEVGGSGAVIDAMCDDYIHGGEPGDMWEANITNLGTGNISLTRFNTTPGLTALYPLMLYDEAGWLLLETQDVQSSEWKQMNYAVWNIFDPSAPCNSDCESWLQAARNEAQHGFPGVDFYKVYIVTPTSQHDPDPNSIQEFMYIGEDTHGGGSDQQTTPEPGTLVLLGSGLVAAFGRRFFR
jgi:hypothetical protein